MKNLFSIFIIFILVILTPLLISLTAIRVATPSSIELKTSLVEAKLYQSLATQAQSLVTNFANSDEEETSDIITPLLPLLETTLTPTYFQTKIEALIDSTVLWVSDSKNPSPTISFNDLYEQILSDNPDFVTEIQTLIQTYQEELPELQEQLATEAKNSGEPPMVLPQIDPNILTQSNFSFDLSGVLGWLKPLYQLTHLYFIVLLIIYIALTVGLVVINLPRPFKTLSIACLTISLSLIPLSISMFFLSQSLSTTAIISHLPPLLTPIISILLVPILKSASNLSLFTLAGFFCSFVVFLILHQFSRTKITPTKSKK